MAHNMVMNIYIFLADWAVFFVIYLRAALLLTIQLQLMYLCWLVLQIGKIFL